MLIDEMVAFCHRELMNKHCSGCSNDDLCRHNCKNCLDDLHYHRNKIRDDYSCEYLAVPLSQQNVQLLPRNG